MTRTEANDDLARYITALNAQGKKPVVAYCFRETRTEVEKLVPGAPVSWVNVLHAGFIPGASEKEAVVIFAESGLDHDHEQKLLDQLEQGGYRQQVPVFNSLEDPIFIAFGAERIRKVMNMMGIKPGECIEHRTITSSMEKMQRKLKEKNVHTYKTESRAEMARMMENLKAK